MENTAFISIYQDTRRAKSNGKFPVKLRVFTSSPRKQKLYPTRYEFSEKEFQSIWGSTKPRLEYKQIRSELLAVETKAIEAAKVSQPFSFAEFEKRLFRKVGEGENIIYQYDLVIQELKTNNQIGTASNYELSIKSLLNFVTHSRGKEPGKLVFNEITPEWLERYEQYMTGFPKKRSITTVAMYLRPLRAVFNTAIAEKEIGPDLYPFGKRKYQIPAVRNVKKAFGKNHLKQLFESEPTTPEQIKAKDFWFFSYSCNGMNIKDIALMRYKDLQDGKIIFYRAKTINTAKADLRPVTVYLTDFAKEVIAKYGNKDKNAQSLVFPIISDDNDPIQNFREIKNFTKFINQNLKKLALKNGITGEISTYWARHSFATNAIRNGASLEFVGEALSHNNMKTTIGYFAGFEDDSKKEIASKLMEF